MSLEEQFHQRMLRLCHEANPVIGRHVSPLRSSITRQRGLGAAKSLLYQPSVTTGFEKLYEKKRLDLAVEAVVLELPWQGLFTDHERGIARRRLEDAGYQVQEE